MYQHQTLNGDTIALPVGKVVCVGRNYAEHAKELNNPIPDQPLLFIKPNTCLQHIAGTLCLHAARGVHHYETELALLVGETITAKTVDPISCIQGVGLALDLTLRELQAELKQKGHPWERAKAFDGACPISGFVEIPKIDLAQLSFSLKLNQQLVQQGDTTQMLFGIKQLLNAISADFTLMPGDIVLTGTPKGVGQLQDQDKIELSLHNSLVAQCQVEYID